MKKVLDTLAILKAAIFLLAGITLLVVVTGLLLITFGVIAALGALIAPKSTFGRYGFQLWIGFDKFWNAALRGSHKETISSRLGKSLYYDHPPVFFFKPIDKLVSWALDQVDPEHSKKSIDWKVGFNKNKEPT